ncbi:WXG100 family type VII secretion target [Citricoccus muralis]|uniref:ESAT-6-like protein n=1 Tax=Citricoccus muralis TaxID=169134 RepID=A0ABY8H862_9MICC|nr:WXG100 family type VII secretion target [Citricoccus muralis]WFP16802.1 WXG100 family type VII secretion target [Citricoccus muralis]
MNTIRVDYAVIATALTNLANGYRDINTNLENMDQDLLPLVEQWTGEASGMYQQSKAEWTDGMNNMNGILDRLRQTLAESVTELSGSDIRGRKRLGG